MTNPPFTPVPGAAALPTFLCLGSQRCASTWLQRVLERHPEVGMAPKEPDYWSREVRRRPPGWYADLFRDAGAAGKPARGDVSPSYAAMGAAEVAVVREALPDLRLILLVRDPVDRICSAITRRWTYVDRDRGAAPRPVRRLMREADAGLSTRFTDYERTVRVWGGAFGRDRLLVLRYEDVGRDPAGVAGEVCRFLGVAPPGPGMAGAIAARPNRSKSAPVPDRLRRHLARVWLPRTRRFAATSGLDLAHWVTRLEREAAAATPADRRASLAERVTYELPVSRGLYPLARGVASRRRAAAARRALAASPAAPAAAAPPTTGRVSHLLRTAAGPRAAVRGA